MAEKKNQDDNMQRIIDELISFVCEKKVEHVSSVAKIIKIYLWTYKVLLLCVS